MSKTSLGIAPTKIVGRDLERRDLLKRIRNGGLAARFVVFQGKEGVGKSYFASQIHAMYEIPISNRLLLDLRTYPSDLNLIEWVVGQVVEFGYARFPKDWEKTLQTIEQGNSVDSLRRLSLLLKKLSQRLDDGMILLLDHLEILQEPNTEDPSKGGWRSPLARTFCKLMLDLASKLENLVVVACSPYRTAEYEPYLFPLASLPTTYLETILDRYDGLNQLRPENRQRLFQQMDGNLTHLPFLNDLIRNQQNRYRCRFGEKALSRLTMEIEWQSIIDPVFSKDPSVNTKETFIQQIFSNLLDESAQKILTRMTFLRQSWSWDSLGQLLDVEEQKRAEFATQLLTRTCLVQSEESDREAIKYGLRSDVRHWVEQKQAMDPQLRKDLLQRLAQSFQNSSDTATLELRREAGQMLYQAEDFNSAFDQLHAVWKELLRQNRTQEALQVLQPFLDYAALILLDRPRVADLLGSLGETYVKMKQLDQAVSFHERQLTIVTQLKDWNREVATLGLLADAYLAKGYIDKAIKTYTRQLEMVKKKLDRESESRILGLLGKAHVLCKQLDKAVSFFEEQLILTREIQDRQGESESLAQLGALLSASGKTNKSVSVFEQRLQLVRAEKNRKAESQTLMALATTFLTTGQFQKAIPYLEQRLVINQDEGDAGNESQTLLNLGAAYYSLGQYEKAIRFFEQRLSLTRELEDRKGEGQVLSNLGLAFADLGQVEKAIGYLEQASQIGLAVKDLQLQKVTSTHLTRLRNDQTKTHQKEATLVS